MEEMKMKFDTIAKGLSKLTGRTGLVVMKKSPEILIVVGVVSVVTSGILACRATLKVDAVLDDTNAKIEKIKIANEKQETESGMEYSESDYKKDLGITYAKTAIEFVKLYGPAIALGTFGIGCILGSHKILSGRNLAITAAYKAVEKSFNDYRNRVVSKFGEDEDRCLKNGIKKESVTVMEMNEKGKTVTTSKTIETVEKEDISQYARFFDESCANWSKTPEYNLMFLNAQQNFANDLLNARGHVFLNEAYDMLGIPRTQAGAVVGWVKGAGDDYIDFGIFEGKTPQARNFVNGNERNILLDFNVAGVIYDLI
jgi:hypothetical protein